MGNWVQMSLFLWPACVTNASPRGTGVPCADSPIGQKHVATSTFPWIFPARTHAKEKQLTGLNIGVVIQIKKDVALFFLPVFQLFISCGMFLSDEKYDHIPSSPTSIPLTSVGGVQSPGPKGGAVLPPATSVTPGPGNIGQVHSASGKILVQRGG